MKTTATAEIDLMTVECRLDRLQNALRKAGLHREHKEACLALGEVRSVLEYHKFKRQKTLVGFGCFNRIERFSKHKANYLETRQ